MPQNHRDTEQSRQATLCVSVELCVICGVSLQIKAVPVRTTLDSGQGNPYNDAQHTDDTTSQMKKHLRPISLRKRRSTHGFLVRMRTRGGQKTLNRRRQKGRWQLIPV